MTPAVAAYIGLSALLFVLGGLGVLLRRSPLAMLMSVEIMWNAANLAFITFARQSLTLDGQVYAFLVLTVAAAEAAIGLAIIVLLFRHRANADVDEIHALRG